MSGSSLRPKSPGSKQMELQAKVTATSLFQFTCDSSFKYQPAAHKVRLTSTTKTYLFFASNIIYLFILCMELGLFYWHKLRRYFSILLISSRKYLGDGWTMTSLSDLSHILRPAGHHIILFYVWCGGRSFIVYTWDSNFTKDKKNTDIIIMLMLIKIMKTTRSSF